MIYLCDVDSLRTDKIIRAVKNLSLLAVFCSCLVVWGGPAQAADEPVFFPTPQEVKWGGQSTAKKSFSLNAGDDVAFSTVNEYKTFLREWGFESGNGGVAFSLTYLPPAECEKVVTPPAQKKSLLDFPELQAYFLTVKGGDVTVKACGEDGFFYALMTFKNLWQDTADGVTLYNADITDFPVFPVRGLFEGAYGMWDLEGRLKVLDWMGEVKLNSFTYGPKGDPKIRRSWREPYSDIELFNFKRMVERANRNHIQFGYVIAPPQGVEYGSDADFGVLLKKVRQLQSLGVKYFVIAFDDTMGMMYSPRDRERFANLGEAESFLTNRLYKALAAYDSEVMLVIVPEIYAGVYPMDYTNSLVEKLLPEIYIGWTGSEIGAPKIDPADMQKFIDFYKRMPSLGDNWGTLFPLLGRDPEIHKYTTQFAMNPYNLFGEIPIPGVGGASEPAMMPIEGASLAEFGWNPYTHDPDDVVNRLSQIYFKHDAREIFKFLMYKELYHFLGYYPVVTDYVPPLETAWRKLLEKPDENELQKQLEQTRSLLENISANLGLVQTGCVDEDMGKSMAVRADVAPPYIEKLLAALTTVEKGLSKKDAALQKQGIESFLKALKGEEL